MRRAFLNDPESREAAQSADVRAQKKGNIRDAIDFCARHESPDVLLVDLDGEPVAMPRVEELQGVCRPETTIIVCGSNNDARLANTLYRMGIALYLPKPLDAKSLEGEIEQAQQETRPDESFHPATAFNRFVLVIGKGAGVTTFTALLARMIAAEGRYVTCLDLDPNFGTLALALDAVPQRGLVELLDTSIEALDENAFDRVRARVAPRISLVAHTQEMLGEPFGESNLPFLAQALARHAHVLLVDGLDVARVEMLNPYASTRIVVYEPTVPGLAVAVRWLSVIGNADSLLVCNRPRKLPDLLDASRIQEVLGGRGHDADLPFLAGLPKALSLGEPMAALGRRERKALAQLVQPLLVPETETA